jgi:hypothetical protein
MHTRHLIDGIVQQTTVLIAQLSTAAGIRAPLARVADQVFYELSREIERQGVGRKVAADMFGLALRAYQKKVQRLSESVTMHDRTLWEAVLDFVREEGPTSRRAIGARFKRDSQLDVAAVLNDLVTSGLVYGTGRGDGALFGVTSDAERTALAASDAEDSVAHLVWLAIFRKRTIELEALLAELHVDEALARAAVGALVADGRASLVHIAGKDHVSASEVRIPVGAEGGWEAAVFDHYQAVCTAIGAKLRAGRTRSDGDDVVGGATLRFEIHEEHAYAERVESLLRRVRAEVNTLWEEVSRYNDEHPVPAERARRVCFYFGQCIEDAVGDGPGAAQAEGT